MRLGIIFSFIFFLHGISYPQFKSASIGIDGLTCSMCSNSVEKLIRQLDFVGEVKMNLNDAVAQVKFKPDKVLSINKLAQKVKDAGYSIRNIKATFQFDSLYISNNYQTELNGQAFQFIGITDTILNGDHEIQFIGKNYLSKKEFEKWKGLINSKNKDIYYVTF